MISPARTTAFDVLRKVETGGWASDLLRAAAIDSRDAALASEIVFGVLRRRAQLDFLIGHYAGSRHLDAEVCIALRMGIYQLRYLERIPAHAAVAESVELVKRARKRSAAGLVNAVLRKVDRGAAAWPSREIAWSCPEWLLARWERHFGAAAAERIACAALRTPETYVRIPPGTAIALPDAEPTEVSGCYRVAADRAARAGIRIQDIGAQSIVPLLCLETGQRFLDLCAAPGNKTAQALEAGVRAVACDRYGHRLAHLKNLPVPLVVLDGTASLPFGHVFDRILLDAPCSGTGTLARNPEIKWRLSPDDLLDLQRRQMALLANARAALAPGGLLVYSTCSLEPEENEDVVAGLRPGLVISTMRRLPGRDSGDGFFAAVIKSDQPAND
ncbi:MAG TPA: transcription antitermination factor NusB [Bryobacteraceae bacterium]|nr:transcription antitermination factor NusB [Bryobacteraceae bacterium]